MQIQNRYLLLAFFLLVPGQGASAADPSSLDEVIISSPTHEFENLDKPIQFVSEDFDPTLLDNLALPVTPPPGVALPTVIVGKNQWKGGQCGITRRSDVVIRQQETWVRFWTLAMSPYSPRFRSIPVVDFSKYMVVGVFMGDQPYPNREIEILSAKIEAQGSYPLFVVRYKNVHKMQGVFTPPFKVQPFHLVRIPVYSERVVFKEGKSSPLTDLPPAQ